MPITIRYRSKFKIINDILRTILENLAIKRRHKTTAVKYLKVLIEQDLLRISHDAGPYRHYEITPKGVRFLKVFAEIEDDLRPV
jgi:predicted transcriptional regulator